MFLQLLGLRHHLFWQLFSGLGCFTAGRNVTLLLFSFEVKPCQQYFIINIIFSQLIFFTFEHQYINENTENIKNIIISKWFSENVIILNESNLGGWKGPANVLQVQVWHHISLPKLEVRYISSSAVFHFVNKITMLIKRLNNIRVCYSQYCSSWIYNKKSVHNQRQDWRNYRPNILQQSRWCLFTAYIWWINLWKTSAQLLWQPVIVLNCIKTCPAQIKDKCTPFRSCSHCSSEILMPNWFCQVCLRCRKVYKLSSCEFIVLNC